MQVKPWMPPKPGFHARVFVGPVIVHDQMQCEMGWRLGIDFLEEADELLVAMSRQAIADDGAIKQAQRREQGRGAVPFIVVCHGPTATLLQWKTRLGAIESVNLAFLVNGEHQRLVRRIEVEPDHVMELLDKLSVAAELERPDEVRLETVPSPDPANGGLAETLGLGHGPRAPVSGRWGSGLQRGFDDGSHFAFGDARDTTGARGVTFQPGQAEGQKPFSPELNSGAGDGQGPGNILIGHAIGRHLNNPGSLDESEGDPPAMRPGGQNPALLGGQQDRDGTSHGHRVGDCEYICQPIYDALH